MIPEDGVEAFTEQEHLSGLEYMKRFYGADIMKVSERRYALKCFKNLTTLHDM